MEEGGLMFLITIMGTLLIITILLVGNYVSLVPIDNDYEVNIIKDTEVQVDVFNNILKDKEFTVNEVKDDF